MSLQFQPMPLLKRALPFDDADWIFELKYDGFRQYESALAALQGSRKSSKNVDPIRSARAFWAQSMRRKMPKAEQERRRLAYEALKGKS